MDESAKDVIGSVYEIGYLVRGSVPEEKVPSEAEAVKKLVMDAGASVVAEEVPHREHLSYTMRKKTVSGSYEKYDEAYFGWIKFEASPDKAEPLKKAVESLPSILRLIMVSALRENTYLGKRAPAFSDEPYVRRAVPARKFEGRAAATVGAPASVEEMDKSIDEMVKEV